MTAQYADLLHRVTSKGNTRKGGILPCVGCDQLPFRVTLLVVTLYNRPKVIIKGHIGTWVRLLYKIHPRTPIAGNLSRIAGKPAGRLVVHIIAGVGDGRPVTSGVSLGTRYKTPRRHFLRLLEQTDGQLSRRTRLGRNHEGLCDPCDRLG